MKVEYIDFLVEEPSMETFLRTVLPRLISDVPFAIYSFQSKNEMLKRLPDRLRGYASWLPEHHRIVVLIDQDDDDCLGLKQQLEGFAQKAGLFTRNRRNGHHFTVINRIVIEELEAWYFGDWSAVCRAYPRVAATIPKQKGFRDPDSIAGGTWEAFERVLKRAGYFKTGLRKIEAARAVAEHIDPFRNTSSSFQAWRDAILALVDRQPV